jgi:hypothetical protein
VDVKALLNSRPGLMVGICLGVIVLALGGGMWMSSHPTAKVGSSDAGKLYFSADDGATYKAFPPSMIPPFEDGGKTWVRARVFKCPSGQPKLEYLEQYSPPVRERLVQMSGNYGALFEALDSLSISGSLVKKPGAKEWLVRNPASEASVAITEVKCGTEKATEVLP